MIMVSKEETVDIASRYSIILSLQSISSMTYFSELFSSYNIGLSGKKSSVLSCFVVK